MNNDIIYLISTTLGTGFLMYLFVGKKFYKKILSLTLASFLLVQAGVCVYKGVNGLHLKKKSESIAVS